jgi:hypothetical protein
MGESGAVAPRPPSHMPAQEERQAARPGRRGRRVLPRWSVRLGRHGLGVALTAALLLPVAALLVAGVWAAVAGARALWQLWQLLTAWQFDAVPASLATLTLAGRVALASTSFFALLLALVIVTAGLHGGPRRLPLLVVGVAFAAAAALACYAGLRLSLDLLAPAIGLPVALANALIAYALLDAIVLAAPLLDAPRVPGRSRRRARTRTSPQSSVSTISATLRLQTPDRADAEAPADATPAAALASTAPNGPDGSPAPAAGLSVEAQMPPAPAAYASGTASPISL